MKIRVPGSSITLDSVNPSAGVVDWYNGYLSRLINEMHKEIRANILKLYENVDPETSAVSFPHKKLTRMMESERQSWGHKFNLAGEYLAPNFCIRSIKHFDLAFGTALKKVGIPVKQMPKSAITMDAKTKKTYQNNMPTISFEMTPDLKKIMQKRVSENVDLIKSIPEQYLGEVESLVETSVSMGRDIATLTDRLQERFDIARRRAAFIARDQNNKFTAQINQTRQLELGITKAIWRHTAASLQPRESHAEFDGEEFDVEEGVDFDDDLGPVLPGEAFNCQCLSLSLIPGFDTEEAPEDGIEEETQ